MSTSEVGRSTSTVNANVSRVVRILMALSEMSQSQLALRLHMDKATMSNSLSGKRRWTLDDIERLGEVFDRPMSYFLEPADTLVRNRCFRQEDSRELVGAAA